MLIKENIHYVGKVDWELRSFHGEELSTYNGTSFNSYLIKADKNVLIDAVWTPFTGEFIKNLEKLIDLKDIDYIVSQHSEPDHSGALAHLMMKIPDTPIYCTKNGKMALKGHYHKDWNFHEVKTGDTLDLGNKTLTFIEAPMLHWPDTMMSYLSGDNVLFSNDIFGQHLASEFLFDDLVDEPMLDYEALKYFVNIISPFSKKVEKKMEELAAMNLKIDLVCPAHGISWRTNINKIMDKYSKWARGVKNDKIVIIYDTMYNSTRKMAEAIAAGIKQKSPQTEIKIFKSSNTDKSDLLVEVFESKGVLVGSPNINGSLLSSITSILEEIKILNLISKKAASFGSYGWSPVNIKVLNTALESAGFEIVSPGLKQQWVPDNEALLKAEELGREFAEAVS
jgi:anaerobic nitric oxide reductase flavorubredoxin